MRALLALALVAAVPAMAGEPCFDPDDRRSGPLQPSLALPGDASEPSDGGQRGGLVWARRRGRVERPIEKLRAFLEDPRHFKDDKVDEMTLRQLAPGPNLSHVAVHSLVRPFPLVTVEWTDEWTVSLLAGTEMRPEKLLVSYQKVAGTSYIAHWCGDLVLTRVDEDTTDVAQYEEAKITGRSHEEMKQGLAGFLETLRALP
jgi:hypothetical protein